MMCIACAVRNLVCCAVCFLIRARCDLLVLAVAAGLGALPATAGHPGQHLDVRISISDRAVVYEIILSTDLSNVVILNDYDAFRAAPEENKYYFVDPRQEQRTRAAFDEFFAENNPVAIDGVPVRPILTSLELIPNPGLAGTEDPFSFPPDTRIVLTYPVKGSPKQVSMIWDLYPQDVTRAVLGQDTTVEVVAELDAYDKNKIIVFTADEPEVIWHASGKPAREKVSPVVATFEPPSIALPLVSLTVMGLWAVVWLTLPRSRVWRTSRRPAATLFVLALAAAVLTRGVLVTRVPAPWAPVVWLPGEQEVVDLFTALHRNVYRAFDYKTESDIYDVLAQSVDGYLLDQVYNEVYQSLILRDQGGAVARVQSVDILDADVESAGVVPGSGGAAFQLRSRWQVHGAVYHWGHVHSRTNEYDARYTVAQRGGNWKITGVEVLQQQRIVFEDDDPPVSPRETPDDGF